MRHIKQIALGLALLLCCGFLSASFGFTTLAQRLMAVGGGGGSYTGPGDVVGSALMYLGVRGYNAAYVTGSNNSVTTVTASGGETCDFFIATNGNLGVAHNCTGGSNNATAATFCTTSCRILNAIDQSGSSNTGNQPTSGNQPALNIATSPFTGYSTSFGFTGANSDYFNIGSGTGPDRANFSWLVWLRTNGIGSTVDVMGGGSGDPLLALKSTGKIQLYAPGLTADLCTSVTSLSATTWTHVAITFDNSTGTCKIYLNSVLDKTLTTTTQSFALSGIAVGGGGDGFWDGQMAEVIVYGSVLTQTQITNIYNNATSNP